jgi:hypothetical protein
MSFRKSASRICGLTGLLLIAVSFIVASSTPEPALAQRKSPSQPTPQQLAGPRVQPAPAQAQPQRGAERNQVQGSMEVSVSAGFRTALEPHGRWQHHPRFREVWIPANRSRDWRPYTVGRWVYNEDWGWYWVEDREEAAWGWVTYHYGRWIEDADLGWAWIPREKWGPGFVLWRHGKEYVGWAPLPPDEVIIEYREKAEVWVFVRIHDFVAAPRLAAVILPVRDYPVLVRETVVVNQTVIVREDRRFAVNPGIPATVIAAAIGRPIRSFDVRPHVLAGTAQIPGAIEVRAQDVRSGRFRVEADVRESRNEIRPTNTVQQLQPLAPGEPGRLGDNPPRAVQRFGARPSQQPAERQGQPQQAQQPPAATTGQQQQGQPQQQGQQQMRQQQGRGKQEPAQTQGRGAREQLQPQQQGQEQQGRPQQRQRQGRGKQEPAQTRDRANQEERQGRQPMPQQHEEQGKRPVPQRQGTEGRGSGDTQRSPTERSGVRERPPAPTERGGDRKQRPDQGTSGHGGGAAGRPQVQQRPQVPQHPQMQQRPQVQERSQPQQRGGPGATEGRGGGAGSARALQGRER